MLTSGQLTYVAEPRNYVDEPDTATYDAREGYGPIVRGPLDIHISKGHGVGKWGKSEVAR